MSDNFSLSFLVKLSLVQSLEGAIARLKLSEISRIIGNTRPCYDDSVAKVASDRVWISPFLQQSIEYV